LKGFVTRSKLFPRAELSAHAFAIIPVKPLRKFFPLQRAIEVTPTMARAETARVPKRNNSGRQRLPVRQWSLMTPDELSVTKCIGPRVTNLSLQLICFGRYF
jgi:hypothetical protein